MIKKDTTPIVPVKGRSMGESKISKIMNSRNLKLVECLK